MHRLKIFGFIAIGDGRFQAAHFRGKGVQSLPAPHNGGTEFFPVLDQENGVVGKPADNAVGTVDNEPSA
jgi:hypothetical protein